jgi:hypothetical protein
MGLNKQTVTSLLLLIGGIASIFWQFFFKQLYLFPGNYMLAWFEPYKSDNFSGSFISLAHKAIAEDTFKSIYPFKVLAFDLIKHFQLPLWNPYNGSGMPLLAAINPGYFDPLNVLYLVFSSPLAWTLIIILETVLIGVFIFLYAKSIKLNNQASVLTAVIFTLSGAVITRLVYSEFTLGFALLPFSLYLLEKFKSKLQIKYLALLSISVGVLLVSTHFQYSLYVLAFISLYWIARCGYEKSVSGLKKLFLPFLFMALGLGLSAIQLAPTFELFKYANLNTGSSSFIFNTGLVPLKHLLTILIPNYFGSPATYNYWGVYDYIETTVYLGLIPCLFAFLSLLKLKDKLISTLLKFYLLMAVLTVLICLQLPFVAGIYALHIPLFSVGVPTRIFFLSSFSLAILAGFGYQYWVGLQDSRKKLLISLSIFSSLVGLVFIFTVFNLHSACPAYAVNCHITSLRNTLIELGGFVSTLVLIIAYLVLNLSKKKYGQLIPFLVILIVYAIGFYNSYKYLPFSPKETFYPKSQVVENIKHFTNNSRILGIGDANILPDLATYFHFYDPNYVNPLYIKRYGELVNFANTGIFPPSLSRSDVNIGSDATPSAALEMRRNRLLSLLSINFLLYKQNELPSGSSNVWENDKWAIIQRQDSLPRTYLVNALKVTKNDKQTLQMLFAPAFNPAETAVVEQNQTELTQIKNNEIKGSAVIKAYHENNILIETKSPTDSFLVLSDNYYPGWKAFIDNHEATIYRTNYTLRGVAVPAGAHNVYFVYDPLSFKMGFLLSVLSGSILLVIILFPLFKKRLRLPLS